MYRKAEKSTLENINAEAKTIAQRLKLDDKIERYPPRNAVITLKDHKDNLLNHPECRLINPAKSEIGKISKCHLDIINSEAREKTGLNQWRNTAATLNWFNSLSSKANYKFLKFDIMDFYPSTTVDLLSSAINFAREFAPVNDDIINIIMHCRKSLLFCENNTWVKKSGAQFDVATGSFDGAEICELVGLFLQYQLSDLFGKEYVGLYRDDGLAVLQNTPGPKADKVRKVVVQFFQKTRFECHH